MTKLAYFSQDQNSTIALESVLLSYPETTLITCSNCQELCQALYQRPTHLMFHLKSILKYSIDIHEAIAMVENMITMSYYDFCVGSSRPKIIVVIDRDISYSTVKALRKEPSVLGGVSFGNVEDTAKAFGSLLAGKSWWPMEVMRKLPGAPEKKVKKHSGEIILTDRQADIFKLISQRGLSNKKIAQVLGISESTVKVHVSAILKTYRVRNRTQLALSAKAP